jgi:hypothetical protein
MTSIKIIVPLIIAFLYNGCDTLFKDDDDHAVRYEVTGTAALISLLYIDGTENTISKEHEEVPWSYSFRGEKGQVLYLQATNETDSGDVRVLISVDNKLFLEARNAEPFGIASASGNIPR